MDGLGAGYKQGFPGKAKKKQKKAKANSLASSAEYITRDSRGLLQIKPSDAFSVPLTFSPSPKRHVVCQGAFIKLDQRENNVKTPPLQHLRRDMPTGYHRESRCLLLPSSRSGSSTHMPPQRAVLPLCYPSVRPGLRGGERKKHTVEKGNVQGCCIPVKASHSIASTSLLLLHWCSIIGTGEGRGSGVLGQVTVQM